MEFVQRIDLSKLLLIDTVLAFSTSAFTAPAYNLPILLFGAYAQENTESSQSMQMFTGLIGASAIYDIVWLSRNEQHGFIRVVTIILLLLKVPTFLASELALRQRGSALGGAQSFGGNGPTLWSMPGGFTSSEGDGYQSLETAAPVNAPAPPQRPVAQPAPQAYQTV